MSVRRGWPLHLAVLFLACLSTALGVRVLAQESGSRAPVSSAFTFQGRAAVDGVPIDDTCDLRFGLYDTAAAGTQVGSTVERASVPVAGGQFTVQLDFGQSAFAGQSRFLAIELRCPAGSGAYTLLPGRQELTATPYALYAQQVPYTGIIGGPPGFGEGWENVIVVAKSGGQYTSIQAAINSITGASETNRFLVWVAPGIYEERISIPSWVTVRGAGKEHVTVRSTGGATVADSVTAILGNDSSLESVRVELIGSSPEGRAIEAIGTVGSSEIFIRNVEVQCGTTGDCTGVFASVAWVKAERLIIRTYGAASEPVTGPGTGIRLNNGTLALTDFEIRVSRGAEEAYGIYADNGGYTIERGSIIASSSTGAYGIAHLSGGSGIVNEATISGQSLSGFGLGIAVLANTTYFVNDSWVSASGGASATGIFLAGAGGTLKNLDVLAYSSGGRASSIAYSQIQQPVTLDRVRTGRPDFKPDYAIFSNVSGSAQIRVFDSRLYASTASVQGADLDQNFIAVNSLVSGAFGLTHECINSFSEAFNPIGDSC